MKFILLIIFFASCSCPRKPVISVKKDTATGSWQYYDGTENMRWIPDTPKTKK